MAVTPYKVQVLQLPLSQNLTLIMQTTAHPMTVEDNAYLHHVAIILLKEKMADSNVLTKAVRIQLTLEGYNCLKAAFLSTDIVFKHTATFNSYQAKTTITKLNERKNLDCLITKAKQSSCQDQETCDYLNKLQMTFIVNSSKLQCTNLMRRKEVVIPG